MKKNILGRTILWALVAAIFSPATGLASGTPLERFIKAVNGCLEFGISQNISFLVGLAVDNIEGQKHLKELEAVKNELRGEIADSSTADQVALKKHMAVVDKQISILSEQLKGHLSDSDHLRLQAELTKQAAELKGLMGNNQNGLGLLKSEVKGLKARLEAIENRYVFNPGQRSVVIRVRPFEIRSRDAPRDFVKSVREYFGSNFAEDERVQLVDGEGADVVIEGAIESLVVTERSYRVQGVTSSNIQYSLDANITARNARTRQIYSKKTYAIVEVEHVGNFSQSRREANILKALDRLARRASRDVLNVVFWDPTKDPVPIVEDEDSEEEEEDE